MSERPPRPQRPRTQARTLSKILREEGRRRESFPLARRLFYPCCGTDFAEAIAFGQQQGVNEFWFVDSGYTNLRSENSRLRRSRSSPVSALRNVVGEADEVSWDRLSVQGLSPHGEQWSCDTLVYRVGERTYILAGGDGFSVMWHFLHDIQVFFYRGDSGGEGGSGVIWLGDDLLPRLVCRLGSGALLVTDGSNGSMVPDLSRFLARRDLDPQNVLDALSEFTVDDSRLGGPVTFSPVEVLGERYGPTVAWRVARHGVAPLQPMR